MSNKEKSTRRVPSHETVEKKLRDLTNKALSRIDKEINKAVKENNSTLVITTSLKLADTYFKYEIEKEKLILKGKTPAIPEPDEFDPKNETSVVKSLKRKATQV